MTANTRNKSFIKLWRRLQDADNEKKFTSEYPEFILKQMDETLSQYAATYFSDAELRSAERLSDDAINRLVNECKDNIWYYFRELCYTNILTDDDRRFDDDNEFYKFKRYPFIITDKTFLLIYLLDKGCNIIIDANNIPKNEVEEYLTVLTYWIFYKLNICVDKGFRIGKTELDEDTTDKYDLPEPMRKLYSYLTTYYFAPLMSLSSIAVSDITTPQILKYNTSVEKSKTDYTWFWYMSKSIYHFDLRVSQMVYNVMNSGFKQHVIFIPYDDEERVASGKEIIYDVVSPLLLHEVKDPFSILSDPDINVFDSRKYYKII